MLWINRTQPNAWYAVLILKRPVALRTVAFPEMTHIRG